MKSLLERTGARIETARRWVRWLRDRRSLQLRIESLEVQAASYRVRIDRLKSDIEARDALIRDYRRQRQEIPDDAKQLIDGACAVFEQALHSKSLPVAAIGSWLSDHRVSRFVRAGRGRHG